MKEKCVSIAKMAIIDDNEISEIAGTRLAIMHDDSSSGASNATGRACDKMTPVPHSSVSLQTDSTYREEREDEEEIQKEEGRPKRPLSAYNVFFQYARVKLLNGEDCTEVRQEELEAMWLTTKPSSVGKRSHRKSHGKISFREMATMVASKWNSLDEKTRSVLKLRAKIDRDRYNVEMEIWKQKGAGPTDVYQGLAIRDRFYHATTSSQGLLPALIDHTMYPQQHGAPLHTMPVPSFSTPVMYQPQSHYSASHLHPVRKENVSAFHVPQVNRSETSPMPLTTSYSTVLTPVVQTGPPAGCYYQSSPFTVVQPTVPNHCIAAPPLPFGTAMMERPLTHSITPNGIVGSKDTLSSSNKTGVDHNIYSEEIGALSDDEDDLFESFE